MSVPEASAYAGIDLGSMRRVLFKAIKHGDVAQVRALLGRVPILREQANIPSKFVTAFTGPLMRAAYLTPLQYACYKNAEPDITQLLIQLGCDPHNPAAIQVPPLHLAARSGNVAAIYILLDAGVDVYAKDYRGCTCFEHACCSSLKALNNIIQPSTLSRSQANELTDWVMVGFDRAESASKSSDPVQTTETRSARNSAAALSASVDSHDYDGLFTFSIIPAPEMGSLTQIGSGAFGQVYRTSLYSQTVAVKRLTRTSATQDEQKNEFEILARCKHVNIISLIGVSFADDCTYIYLEYADGGSLYRFIHNEKQSYNLATVRRFGLEIATGMQYLVSKDILHRDLKSLNVLLSQKQSYSTSSETTAETRADRLVCKICDFGLSKKIYSAQERLTLAGTVQWMSPEVIREEQVSSKSDVYSYGVVLWELLTRRLPFEHLLPQQVIFQVGARGLRPIVHQTFPKVIKEILNECWASVPKERPDFAEIVLRLASSELDMSFDVRQLKQTGDQQQQQQQQQQQRGRVMSPPLSCGASNVFGDSVSSVTDSAELWSQADTATATSEGDTRCSEGQYFAQSAKVLYQSQQHWRLEEAEALQIRSHGDDAASDSGQSSASPTHELQRLSVVHDVAEDLSGSLSDTLSVNSPYTI